MVRGAVSKAITDQPSVSGLTSLNDGSDLVTLVRMSRNEVMEGGVSDVQVSDVVTCRVDELRAVGMTVERGSDVHERERGIEVLTGECFEMLVVLEAFELVQSVDHSERENRGADVFEVLRVAEKRAVEHGLPDDALARVEQRDFHEPDEWFRKLAAPLCRGVNDVQRTVAQRRQLDAELPDPELVVLPRRSDLVYEQLSDVLALFNAMGAHVVTLSGGATSVNIIVMCGSCLYIGGMKNPLAPVSVVDRNGKQTTVHKKVTSSIVPAERLGGVVPVLPKDSVAAENRLLASLIHDLFPTSKEPQGFDQEFSLVRQHDPELLPLARELMSTGSRRARDSVAYWFQSALLSIRGAVEEASSSDIRNWERGFSYKYARNEIQWGTPVRRAVISGWWAGEIENDCGIKRFPYDFIAQMRNIGTNWESLDPDTNGNAGDDSYWRGVAVLAAATVVVDDYGYQRSPNPLQRVLAADAEGFVRFAGSYEDSGALVRLMQERQSIDAEQLETLTHLIAEVGVPLADGVL